MSIIMKYMVGGKVNVNEFNNFEKLLPVMAHVQDEKYPYYVMQDGKAIFKYNLQYVEKQAKPAEVYTLRVKYPDKTGSEDYTDLVSLAAATMAANDAEFPWYVVDNAGNIIRKGNLDKLPSKNTTPAPKAGVAPMPKPETPDVDINATIDEMNDALGYDDDCGPSEEELREASLALYTTSSEYRPISRLVYEVSWLTETGHKSQQFEKLEDARSFCETLAYYKLSYLRINMNGQISGVYLIDRRDAEIPVDTEMLIDEFMKDSLPFSEIPELFRDPELISTWLRPSSPRTGCVKFSVVTNLFEVKAYEFTMRQMHVMTNDYVCHMDIWPTIELMANNIAKEIYVVDFYNFNELKPWTDAADKFTKAD